MASLFFWALWPVQCRLRNILLCQRKTLILVIKVLLEHISHEKTFKIFFLSFCKLPITWYVPALIYLKGLCESRVADAPIQPSQRSTSVGARALCPFQRQSFFDQVHQSLKKDSLAIESALRVQRPRSTSSAQTGRFTNLNLLKDKSISVSIWPSSF